MKIRVILISSITPSPTSAGELILHRHLVDKVEIDLCVMNTEPQKAEPRKFFRKAFARLAHSPLERFAKDVFALWKSGWIDAELPPPKKNNMPTVVLTVAHGEACYAAQRYCKKHELPLVTIFHDWWPDMAKVHSILKGFVEKSFRSLYRQSSVALCVCPGMKNELGPHPDSIVLYPIPSSSKVETGKDSEFIKPPLKILYSGNLYEYGPMLMEAMDVLKNDSEIRLEVRGENPKWPEVFKNEMKKKDMWLPYVERAEFQNWLRSADAFLIPQTFDSQYARRMRTSFPSKLTDFAPYSKPLLIWAPPYASASAWAKTNPQAVLINDPNPKNLANSIKAYFRQKIDKDVNQTINTEFHPKRLQSALIGALQRAVE